MFATDIEKTLFSGEIANEIFKGHIESACSIESQPGMDASLISTCRALFGESEEDLNLFICGRSQSSVMTSEGLTDSERIEYNIDVSYVDTVGLLKRSNVHESNAMGIFVTYSNHKTKEKETAFELFEKHFESVSFGYKEIKRVKAFFEKNFKILCYVNEELKSCFVVIDDLTIQKFHAMQTALPIMLPWMGKGKETLTEDDMNFLRTFRERTSDEYIKCINKYAERYDFRTASIKKFLNGFESSRCRAQLREKQSEISSLNARILDYSNSISSLIRDIENSKIIIAGLEKAIEEAGESSEIMNHFINDATLDLVSVVDDRISFTVKTIANIWEDNAEKIVSDHRSALYSHVPSERKDDFEKLFTKIFITREIKLRMCAAFYIGASRFGNAALERFDFGSEFDTYYPNPHINKYSCMSQWSSQFADAFVNGDYIFPIESCRCAAGNLSLNDSTVMKDISYDLTSDYQNKRIFELPDGSIVNIHKAIEYACKGE